MRPLTHDTKIASGKRKKVRTISKASTNEPIAALGEPIRASRLTPYEKPTSSARVAKWIVTNRPEEAENPKPRPAVASAEPELQAYSHILRS